MRRSCTFKPKKKSCQAARFSIYIGGLPNNLYFARHNCRWYTLAYRKRAYSDYYGSVPSLSNHFCEKKKGVFFYVKRIRNYRSVDALYKDWVEPIFERRNSLVYLSLSYLDHTIKSNAREYFNWVWKSIHTIFVRFFL